MHSNRVEFTLDIVQGELLIIGEYQKAMPHDPLLPDEKPFIDLIDVLYQGKSIMPVIEYLITREGIIDIINNEYFYIDDDTFWT